MTETEPLVPAEVDLRDFGFMPLEVVRLRDSELAVEAPPEVFRASVLLWAASWHQVPAASLPSRDSLLADLAKSVKVWPRIRAAVMAEWVPCSDGRLYHPVVAEKAREAWEAKLARIRRTEKATAAKAAKGGTLPPTDDGGRHDPPHDERHDPPHDQRDVARSVHQGKGREGKGDKEKGASEGIPAGVARAPEAAEPERQPTRAGAACLAMRKAGLAAVNPGDPRLLALLEQGATDAELAAMAGEAAAKGKGWGWVLAAVQGRRSEAAAISLAPPPAQTVPSSDAERTAKYLREQEMTPEQRERADAARAEFVAKHRGARAA